MAAAPHPTNEADRLRAVQRYAILDTPPEESFDRIVSLASLVFEVPIVLIDIVASERQWVKASHGLNVTEVDRHIAFCAHAIVSDDVLVVEDTLQDPRFADNPCVTGEPRIRFYAGAPLRTVDGYNLGTSVHPRLRATHLFGAGTPVSERHGGNGDEPDAATARGA